MQKRTTLTTILAVTVIMSSMAAKQAAADSPRPLAVLSLASIDDASDESVAIGEIANAPEMPAWMSAMLQVYAEGRDLNGLERTKPWGVMVQLKDEQVSAFGFLPIRDLESLNWDLYEYIDSTSEVGNGVYKVVGTGGKGILFAKERDGWLFVSDCPETLRTVPTSPQSALHGANKQYDVSVRLEICNIPEKEGRKIMGALEQQLGPVLKQVASGRALEILQMATWNLDHVTLGWWARK